MYRLVLLKLLAHLLLLLRWAEGSLLADADKCLLWLKTDGTNCQPSTYFGLHKMALGYVPSLISRKVCCKDATGCFSIDKDTPYECYQELPQCMDVVKPQFFYYTPERNQRVSRTKTSLSSQLGELSGANDRLLQLEQVGEGSGDDEAAQFFRHCAWLRQRLAQTVDVQHERPPERFGECFSC